MPQLGTSMWANNCIIPMSGLRNKSVKDRNASRPLHKELSGGERLHNRNINPNLITMIAWEIIWSRSNFPVRQGGTTCCAVILSVLILYAGLRKEKHYRDALIIFTLLCSEQIIFFFLETWYKGQRNVQDLEF